MPDKTKRGWPLGDHGEAALKSLWRCKNIANTQEIADHSGIPRYKMVAALGRLRARGLVTSELGGWTGNGSKPAVWELTDKGKKEASWLLACEGPRLPLGLELQAIEQKEGPDRALDLLFEAVDAALFRGHYDGWTEVERWLAMNEPEDFRTTHLIVGVLSITKPCEEKEWRKDWASRARKWLAIVAPDRVDRLMRGLE